MQVKSFGSIRCIEKTAATTNKYNKNKPNQNQSNKKQQQPSPPHPPKPQKDCTFLCCLSVYVTFLKYCLNSKAQSSGSFRVKINISEFLVCGEPDDNCGLCNALLGVKENNSSMKRSKCQTGLIVVSLRHAE